KLPVNKDKPIPADKEFTISDAFVWLTDAIPENDHEKALLFMDCFAKIYLLIPKPESKRHDWPAIAEKVIGDLHFNKGCWTQTDGVAYLNAYVGDYKTPAEIMVQLA